MTGGSATCDGAARMGGGRGRLPLRASLPVLARFAFLLLLLGGAVQAASAAWVPAKAILAQVLLDRAFVEGVETGEPARPWPWADTMPIARVIVPRLEEEAIVLSGASGQALAFGPTELPTGRGQAVRLLAAHRDTHFAFMGDLAEHDIIMLEGLDGNRTSYRVTSFTTVRWDEFAIPRQMAGDWLALSTCWPLNANERGPLRRVAWARKVS